MADLPPLLTTEEADRLAWLEHFDRDQWERVRPVIDRWEERWREVARYAVRSQIGRNGRSERGGPPMGAPGPV